MDQISSTSKLQSMVFKIRLDYKEIKSCSMAPISKMSTLLRSFATLLTFREFKQLPKKIAASLRCPKSVRSTTKGSVQEIRPNQLEHLEMPLTARNKQFPGRCPLCIARIRKLGILKRAFIALKIKIPFFIQPESKN